MVELAYCIKKNATLETGKIRAQNSLAPRGGIHPDMRPARWMRGLKVRAIDGCKAGETGTERTVAYPLTRLLGHIDWEGDGTIMRELLVFETAAIYAWEDVVIATRRGINYRQVARVGRGIEPAAVVELKAAGGWTRRMQLLLPMGGWFAGGSFQRFDATAL